MILELETAPAPSTRHLPPRGRQLAPGQAKESDVLAIQGD
jgi:hypothetical protein